MERSQAPISRLTGVNEAYSRRYESHTTDLEETKDRPRISQDGYASQMAALVPYIEQDRLGATWENLRWLRDRKAALKKSRPA